MNGFKQYSGYGEYDSKHYTGGDGSSRKNAVVITGIYDTVKGIRAENLYIQHHFPGSRTGDQEVSMDDDGNYIDRRDFVDREGVERSIYFDISEWWGIIW